MSEKKNAVSSLSEILANVAEARSTLERIYGSELVHKQLQERLGDVWNDAVQCFTYAPNAAHYLLSPNWKYEHKSPMDSLSDGTVTVEVIRDDIGRIAHGIHV